jgi:biotin carboxylase
MVLGAGHWQADLIEQAQRNGLWVLATDISPTAPGRHLADDFRQVDTNDQAALREIAREASVDLVLTDQTDRTVPVVAHLNEALGLPGIRPEVASRFTNKLTMREALLATGLAMPEYEHAANLSQAQAFAERHGFPLAVKPVIGQASIGVRKVDDATDLRSAFASYPGAYPPVLVESFIEGTEVTVEALTLRGRTKVLGMSEKRHYEVHPCVAKQLAYPPRLPPELLAVIESTHTKVVRSLGLVDGLTHGEYRLRDDVPYLVEVAARGGGNRIASRIVPHVSGVCVYDLLIRALRGEELSCPDPAGRAAVLGFLDVAPGRVSTAPTPDELLRSGILSDAKIWFKGGDRIKEVTDDNTRPGYFIVLGDTRDEVDARASLARDVLSSVVYADESVTPH